MGIEQEPPKEMQLLCPDITLGYSEWWESKDGLHLPLRWEAQERWENSLNFHPPMVWGHGGISEHWSCFTFSYLSAPAASDMSLKPHLGGSSESQIELILMLLHTSHDFASRDSSGSTVFIPE